MQTEREAALAALPASMRDRVEPALGCGEISTPDLRRLARWVAHLDARGVTVPSSNDFLTHGRLSTLERLSKVLAVSAPEDCGQLRVALQTRRREKNAGRSQGNGGRRGPERTLSLEFDELPAEWRLPIEAMRRERERITAGGLVLSDAAPPAASKIRGMSYVLRALAHVCRQRGVAIELTSTTVQLWLEAAERRGRSERGLSLQVRLLRNFLLRTSGKSELSKTLGRLAAQLGSRGDKREKRKDVWLRRNELTLGIAWETAEDLLRDSRKMRPGSRERHKTVLHAACLALGLAAPLRIGDQHRYIIGEHLRRTATGWSLDIVTSKTGRVYSRAALWPELTPFLDEVLILEAIGGDLWRGYDQRVGTPFFSLDGGRTGLAADWVSDVWEEHVGVGAHIARSLWHRAAQQSDDSLAWVALAMCGQADERTTRHYEGEADEARDVRSGRRLLRALRQSSASDGPAPAIP